MPPQRADLETVRLATLLRPGDGVVWGQALATPAGLVRRLIDEAGRIGHLSAFIGVALGDALDAAIGTGLAFSSFGAMHAARRLHKAGMLDVIPMLYSAVPKALAAGRIPCDVALVQLSPPGPDGSHSLGFCNDFLPYAIAGARLVIGEVNSHVPWTRMDRPLDLSRFDIIVESDEAPPWQTAPVPGAAEEAIAARLAALIDDGATLQYGIGAVPTAMLRALSSHRDLGIHSGLLTDELVELVRQGAVTNARKEVLPGRTIGGVAIGSPRLRDFLHDNPAVELHPIATTHGAGTLSRLSRLVAVNSALEVDIHGQINAEMLGSRYVGGIGGQLDYMHAAAAAERGLSVIALPSTTRPSGASRIVPALSGHCVTTCRSAVDVVVTEHGVADLRGRSQEQRARDIIAIADPAHRDALERANPLRPRVHAATGPTERGAPRR